jgi:hypothetical protein
MKNKTECLFYSISLLKLLLDLEMVTSDEYERIENIITEYYNQK